MHKKIYSVAEALDANTLAELLRFAGEKSMKLLLVSRDEEMSDSCKRVVGELSTQTESVVEKSEWPGTRLLGHKAKIFQLKIDARVIGFVRKAGRSNYDYLEPDALEDPCLVRADGTEYFATISHEKDAYFSLTREEKQELMAVLPRLRLKAD